MVKAGAAALVGQGRIFLKVQAQRIERLCKKIAGILEQKSIAFIKAKRTNQPAAPETRAVAVQASLGGPKMAILLMLTQISGLNQVALLQFPK